MLAQHGRDAFATSKLFWAIIIPIGYFALLFALIIGCGYVFQCGAKGRVCHTDQVIPFMCVT